jgi:hypothetical protein
MVITQNQQPVLLLALDPNGNPTPLRCDKNGVLILAASWDLSTLPTSDPHVQYAAWNNGGVLTISNG